jgi:hypothetical protein
VAVVDFEILEKKNEHLRTDLTNTNLEINRIQENINSHQIQLDMQTKKLKESNETLFNIDGILMPTLQTKLTQTATKEELNQLKKQFDSEVKKNKFNDCELLLTRVWPNKLLHALSHH